ncbi:MAG: glucokinase [Pseudomonadota bacterium]
MKKDDDQIPVLAGDIGGTKTYLGLFQKGKGRPAPVVMERYASKDAPDLEHILKQFLNTHQGRIRSACFGIAGPVRNGRCRTTNLPWEVSARRLKERFRWKQVSLVNDVTAMAMAVPLLNSREVVSLNRARAASNGSIGVIAPGTGLGMALLIRLGGNRFTPIPSEGGHVDFAPNHPVEIELWHVMRRQWKHASLERLLSGSGIYNIYCWLKESGRYEEPGWLEEALKKDDPARVISESALKERQPICLEALKRFVSILGAAAGNLALTGTTTGGIYLGGGIAPKILPILRERDFKEAFTNKGRFTGWLEKVPLRVILNDKAALLGAAYLALYPNNHDI